MRRTFIISFFLFFYCGISAQHYYFKSYTPSSGLAGSQVNYVMQDKQGYIWFAAQQSGVSRFDGKNFKTFSKSDGLISNDVSSICEDKQGNIWFSTFDGVSKFDGNHFMNYDVRNGLSDNEVNSIYCDKNGLVWFSTHGGLSCYESSSIRKDSGCFRNFTGKDGLPGNTVYCMLENKAGIYWVGTNRGLCSFDGKKFKKFSTKEGISESKVDNLMEDRKGFLWIGMQKEGITVYDGKSFSKFALSEDFKNDRPYQIIEDRRGNIWMALEHGLLKCSAKGQQFFTKKNGLNVDKVMSVCEDYEGNIWAGTFNGGASLFKGESFVSFGENEGLTNKNVNSIIQDKQDNYFFGTAEGLNKYKGLMITSVKDKPELDKCNIISTFIDSKGLVWIGTQDNGLIVLRYQNGSYVKDRVITQLDGVSFSTITRIIEDRDHRIWFSCYGWGVFVLDRNGTCKHIMAGKGLPSDNVTGLYLDKTGAVWIASVQGGVTKFENGKFTTFNAKNGLPGNSVVPILESNGLMFFGTDDAGLVCYDSKAADGKDDAKFTVISKKEGLSSNNITALLDDGKGDVWIGTDKGLDRLHLSRNPVHLRSVKNYTEQKGYNVSEINPYALYMDDKNKIWIGTIEGVLRYDPEMDFPRDVAPKIELTGIKLFYENVDWGKFNQKATGTNAITGVPVDLQLSYKNNNLTFVFQALTAGEVSYTYMLDGLDAGWSPPKSGTEAVYPNISPGHYTFKVQAFNSDGVSSENTISYSFTITPPFYRTWWFYSISTLAFVLSVFGFVNWRTKALSRDKERLERTVSERTADVVKEKNEVVKQKLLVEVHQKEMVDSMIYAKRLQQAILPPLAQIQSRFPTSFVLYLPKDIVAGDFYWMHTTADIVLIASADCTGHGVPGALVSVVCSNALNRTVKEFGLTETGKILDKVTELVLETFEKSGEEIKDGMDISLLSINKTTYQIQWSGANNPLWIVKGAELTEIKADKQPIGKSEDRKPFTSHNLPLIKGETFYLITDGYADQFSINDKKLMKKKMKELLLSVQDKTMEEQRQFLEDHHNKWKGNMEQTDDVTVIGIKI